MRSLRNISMVEATIKEPVVANNATASTVAFIAPGPPNPPITQVGQLSILSPNFIPPSFNFIYMTPSISSSSIGSPPHFPSLESWVNCQLSAGPY